MTFEKSSPSKPIPRNGIGYNTIRGGAIGILFVSETRINDENPSNKHAAMNNAEKNNQLEKDSFRLS